MDLELGVFFGGLSLRDEARVEPDKDRLRGFVLEGDNLLVFLEVDSSFPVDFEEILEFLDFRTIWVFDIILGIYLHLGIVKEKNQIDGVLLRFFYKG